jgi:hypothetical protein
MRKLSSEEVLWRQRTQTGRLTPMEVGRIKWHLADGKLSPRELASIYNVSLWTIRAIRRGDIWTWVEPNGPDDEVSEQLAAQGLSPPAIRDDRAAEVLKRLAETAGKDPAIQADKLLEQLLDPERAAKAAGKSGI